MSKAAFVVLLAFAAPLQAGPASASEGTLVAAKKANAAKKRKGKRPDKHEAAPAPEAAAPVFEPPPISQPPANLPPPPPLPTGYKAVAVLPLVGLDVDDETVHALEIALMREVDETPGMRAVSPQ